MQNIGSKVLVVFEATVQEITGPEAAPMLIVQDASGARHKVGPDCALDGSVVMAINHHGLGDSVDDQFTGLDLGVAMAAEEGGPVAKAIANVQACDAIGLDRDPADVATLRHAGVL